MDTENFLKIKHRSLKQFITKEEETVLYENFYNDIENRPLAQIFAMIHCSFNNLLSYMNYKNNPGNGGHYNADESRLLMDLIKETKIILAIIEKDPFEKNYELDTEYQKNIDRCNNFLSYSGGSPIPDDFPSIEIIEHQAIFNTTSTISIPNQGGTTNAGLKLIGEGSYAQVFRYKDPYYKVNFALKRAKSELNQAEIKRFELEYVELSKLNSPFIIEVYNYNKEKNEYTMEFAHQTLEDYMNSENQKLVLPQRKKLVSQVLNAFTYIHKKGLLHRDISYRNILLKHYDDHISIVKVSDFGLVKISESQLTNQGTDIKGILNDLSDLSRIGFEKYSIEHETFALAKVVYFILSGKRSNYEKEKNEALRQFILKAISSNKEERFHSVQELHENLVERVYPNLS